MPGKTAWRTEPTRVENLGDELWVGVKGQSNSVIAGSPRNAFRCSVTCFLLEVELLDGRWALLGYLRQPNSECRQGKCGSETAGDKLRTTRGKQPRSPAKAPKRVLSGKGCAVAKTTRRLAYKQQPLKECVIAHWSSDCAPIM